MRFAERRQADRARDSTIRAATAFRAYSEMTGSRLSRRCSGSTKPRRIVAAPGSSQAETASTHSFALCRKMPEFFAANSYRRSKPD